MYSGLLKISIFSWAIVRWSFNCYREDIQNISYSHSRAVKIYFILIRVSNLLEQDKFSSFAYCKFKLKKCSEFIHSLWLNHETNVSLEMKVSKWIPGLRWKILCWFLAESGWRVARKDNLLSWWSGTDFSSAINKSINENK